MMHFVISLLYLVAFVPVIRAAIKLWRRKEEATWRVLKKPVITTIILSGILSLLLIINYFYTEFLWFKDTGYSEIFWKRLLVSVLLFIFGGIISYIYSKLFVKFFNDKFAPRREISITTFWLIFSTGLLASIFLSDKWLDILKWLFHQPFNITDPIFNKDISFYVFVLPVHKLLSSILLVYLLITGFLLFCSWMIYQGDVQFPFERWDELKRKWLSELPLVKHFLVCLLIILIWKMRIAIWSVLYSPRGAVFGAGFTDVKVQIPCNWVFIVLLVIAVGVILFYPRKKDTYFLPGVASAVFISWLLIVVIIPELYQHLIVKPNELAKEEPYIKHNIYLTKCAYKLSDCKEVGFKSLPMISRQELQQYKSTIENIRLWDWGALKDTYRQRQLIRLYYEFPDVDIDRYEINGRYRQVMLAARELEQSKIPVKAQTWVNKCLKYTHGYGLCMSAVSEFLPGGIPNFIVKDIPPISQSTSVAITRPEIYFGELTRNYVIVNTAEDEFDYPKGEENVYCQYRGKRGIRISGLHRLCFAIRFNDVRILLSGAIKSNSKLLWRREIKDRLSRIFQFIYDDDPYIFIRPDGSLAYIIDGYTTTNMYPYSEPYKYFNIRKTYKKLEEKSLNYIRNSVKVIVDAYEGSVEFYVYDETDPIIKTIQKIFPRSFGLTKSDMPTEYRKHVRYPEKLLKIQSVIYSTYHMSDYRVFYNREDQWKIADEVYIDSSQPVEPYYVIIQLHGENKPEFLLMLPFTPLGRDNMIAWFAGRCDEPNYGELVVYKLPKDRMIYGPLQIEARAEQKPEISEKFTLWRQKGSQVIRGNLLVIPVGDSLIYVEPIFLKAEAAALPEIQRVLVAMGDNIEWGETLQEAIEKIYISETLKGVKMKPVSEKITSELYKKRLEDLLSELEDMLKKMQKRITQERERH